MAASADGKLGGQGPVGGDVMIADVGAVAMSVEGIKKDAAVWVVDPETMAMERLVRKGDVFTSAPMQAGMRQFLATAPSAQTVAVSISGGRPMHLSSMLQVGQGPWQVELAPAQETAGLVVDAKGQPVAGAEVVADPDHCAARAVTNARGEFRLPSVFAPPFGLQLIARSKGKVGLGTSFGDDVELRLQTPASLELTFVDPQGNPVEGVGGYLTGNQVSNAQVKSDAAGRWSMQELPKTPVTLRLGHAWILSGDRVFPLKGTVRKTMTVQQGVELKGTVTTATGRPAPGVYVRAAFGEAAMKAATNEMKEALSERGASTNAKGEFVLTLSPGEYEVVANAERPEEVATFAVAPGTVALQLPVVPKVEGQVVDSAGKPVGPGLSVSPARRGQRPRVRRPARG